MRFRGKSIRRKIVALLLVPLVSLTALWGFATVITGREAYQLLSVGAVVEEVGYPLQDTARVIQRERRQTLVYLADPRTSDTLAELRRERAATDKAVARIKDNVQKSGIRDDMTSQAKTRLDSLFEALEGLGSLRRSVEQNDITRSQALTFYNDLVTPCYGLLLSLHTLEDSELDKQGRALVGVIEAGEMLSREDALVYSSLIAGRVTAPELRQMSDLIANRKLLYEFNLENVPARERETIEQYWAGPDTEQLRGAENRLIAAGPAKDPSTVDAKDWQAATTPVLDYLARESTAMGDRYQDRVEPTAYSVLIEAGVAGVLGFLTLLTSVFVSVRIGRELVRDLSGLRKEAHEVSGVRLPSVMRRLASGEQVDVETEAPHLEYDRDEIGQVGQALNTLQRAAVEAAVKQADMRRGVSEVFVNLARRNQVLLHRQLTLLDSMERRTEDTEELADLFRLDHLTTRMRRHAEGLVILSGAAPSRQWRKPIQLMDVVRAAVAEVEDYERIEVRRLPRLGVGGPAVADLTHLIAELLENATVFSPPHTAVQVHGERVANGFTLEIHDRGLGMAPDVLLDANLRLAETPDFELSDTDRLGLFVVSRLAQRQNVRVSLQPSPYGGTTAVVFIPAALLTDAPETQGTGFRLDRKTESAAGRANRLAERRADAAERRGAGRGAPALAPVPTGMGDRAALNGPVELEPPVDSLDFDVLGDLEDTESERGGIFRARERRTGAPREPHQQAPQHQQAPDPLIERAERQIRAERQGRADRQDWADHQERAERPHSEGPVPLPRRTPAPAPAKPGRGPQRSGEQRGTGQPALPTTPMLVSDRGRRLDEAGRTHPVPDQERQAPAPDTIGGLPRRVRQASLAPQLREGTAGRAPAPASVVDDHERDADEVRSRMASLQRGWQRGREQNAEEPGTPTAAETAHGTGTTPEGDGR
ncbi:nitrate- and nitrite sensing domain-containing protein [Streptomyces sp. NPDC050504]|uniref:sensor histidine kinase n=1 Tax=Streptomyces sp. NPDC050504 TaxID=3365618 RepID=UPI0037BC8700